MKKLTWLPHVLGFTWIGLTIGVPGGLIADAIWNDRWWEGVLGIVFMVLSGGTLVWYCENFLD